MNPGLVVKLRPTGPWRIGPDSGARNRVDSIYHSDTLYAAVTGALSRLGPLEDWLAATARSAAPEVCFSSCFPFLDEIGFVVPPRTVWPPTSPALLSARVRWKSARFVPLGIVQAMLSGRTLAENDWNVDAASECLVPAGRPGPFRTGMRWNVAVDRLNGSAERHSTACIEFRPGAGLWTVVSFVDDAAAARWLEPVKTAFRLLADSGFGGERSRGWGRSEMPEFIHGELPEMILPAIAAAAPQEEPAVEGPPSSAPEAPPAATVQPAQEAALPADPQPPTTEPEAPPAATVQPAQEAALPADPQPPTTEPEAPQAAAEQPAQEAAGPAEPEPPTTEPGAPQSAPESPAQEAAVPADPQPPSSAPEAPPAAAEPPADPQPPSSAPEAPREAAVLAPADIVPFEAQSVTAEPSSELPVPEPPVAAGPAPLPHPDPEPKLPPPDPEPSPEPAPPAPEPSPEPNPDLPPMPEPEPAPAFADRSRDREGAIAPPVPGPQPLPDGRGFAGAHPHWLLSLFTPAASDSVDWERGSYALIARGGRIESPTRSGELKKQLPMIAEGSVLYASAAPRGSAPDVAPDGFAHPVYRAGFAVSIPLPEVS